MIDKKVYGIDPVYHERFENLIKTHAQFRGGAADDQYVQAKSFSSAYEFYMYAYFLGLKTNTRVELLDGDKTYTFWEMDFWKPRDMVDYLIVCAIAESGFDMVDIENAGEKEVNAQIRLLKSNIEEFANGGFSYIEDFIREDPDCVEDDRLFIRLLADADA